MSASAWDHGPVAMGSYTPPIAEESTRGHVRPLRGQRDGSARMILQTYLLEGLSVIGLVTTVLWIMATA